MQADAYITLMLNEINKVGLRKVVSETTEISIKPSLTLIQWDTEIIISD